MCRNALLPIADKKCILHTQSCKDSLLCEWHLNITVIHLTGLHLVSYLHNSAR